uniref:Uncharacterized protein n=1 Tax=Mustela putorius furo TaxID=9669 RepID=M3YBX6_MUSPF
MPVRLPPPHCHLHVPAAAPAVPPPHAPCNPHAPPRPSPSPAPPPPAVPMLLPVSVAPFSPGDTLPSPGPHVRGGHSEPHSRHPERLHELEQDSGFSSLAGPAVTQRLWAVSSMLAACSVLEYRHDLSRQAVVVCHPRGRNRRGRMEAG